METAKIEVLKMTEEVPEKRRRKVTAAEAQRILVSKSYPHKMEVIETATGDLAIASYRGITLILPSEWDLDEWDRPINPLAEYACDDAESTLLTETNLDFGNDAYFLWLKVDNMQPANHKPIQGRLCDPREATHIFVDNMQLLRVKKLADDDFCEFLPNVRHYSFCMSGESFLMPIGYIRLQYVGKDGEVHTIGSLSASLEDHFRERAQKSVLTAQSALEDHREDYAKQATINRKALVEFERLKPQIDELKQRYRGYIMKALTAQREQGIAVDNRSITGCLEIGPDYNSRFSIFGRYFDCSEDGIAQISAILAEREQELQAELKHVVDD